MTSEEHICARPRVGLANLRELKKTWSDNQSDFPRLAGGKIPFIRRYSTICP